MWQRCLHTFHSASSFGVSRGRLTILCPTQPPLTGIMGLRGRNKTKQTKTKTKQNEQKNGGGAVQESIPPSKRSLIFPLNWESDFLSPPPPPKLSSIFFPSLWLHILSFLHPHIKNRRGFQRPGCFIFFGQGNHFLSSNYFISYENFG